MYQASIVLTSTGAGNQFPTIIPVTLTISSAPSLTASPGSAVFSYGSNNSPPLPVSIALGSTGTPLPFSASVAGGSPWIVITAAGHNARCPSNQRERRGASRRHIYRHGRGHIVRGREQSTAHSDDAGGQQRAAADRVARVPIVRANLDEPESVADVYRSAAPVSALTFHLLRFLGDALAFGKWIRRHATERNGIGGCDRTGSRDVSGRRPDFIHERGNSPLSIPVSLVVMETASLQANPSPVSFSYKQAGPAPSPQTVGGDGRRTSPS